MTPPRRVAFTKGDTVAIVLGTAFALFMLGWFTWNFVGTVRDDRAVTPAQNSAHPGH